LKVEDRPDRRLDGEATEPTPRIIVKAILQPPVVDAGIARALVAKYIPPEDR
jgi:hypothetical protein